MSQYILNWAKGQWPSVVAPTLAPSANFKYSLPWPFDSIKSFLFYSSKMFNSNFCNQISFVIKSMVASSSSKCKILSTNQSNHNSAICPKYSTYYVITVIAIELYYWFASCVKFTGKWKIFDMFVDICKSITDDALHTYISH